MLPNNNYTRMVCFSYRVENGIATLRTIFRRRWTCQRRSSGAVSRVSSSYAGSCPLRRQHQAHPTGHGVFVLLCGMSRQPTARRWVQLYDGPR